MAISSSQTLEHMLPLLCLLLLAAATANIQHTCASPPPVTLPGCPDKCGNISIPYPFGTDDRCSLPGFRVICNHTSHPPRAFIESNLTYRKSKPGMYDDDAGLMTQIVIEDLYYMSNYTDPEDTTESETETSVWPIELVGVSVSEGKAWVLGAYSYDCWLNDTHRWVRRQEIRLSYHSPFVLSEADDVLMGIGVDVIAEQSFGPLCQSNVETPVNGTCTGEGCCHAALPPAHHSSKVTIKNQKDVNFLNEAHPCNYAMIVDKSWYNFSSPDLDGDTFRRRNPAGVVPVVVDFIIGYHGCPEAGQPTHCVSNNSVCVERPVEDDVTAHLCRCSPGYEGNPYIPGAGCQDIDECSRPDLYPCYGNCKNTPGDYECTCGAGKRGNAKEGPCTDLFSLPAKISVGIVGGLFIIALLVFLILIRNEKRKMRDFFKKNGGPTLEKAKIIKIYQKEELNPILKRSNFIGHGAFGAVYRGFIDNQLVAIKKPIDGNVAQNDQFANEVIIQSQVIHKNIVKLIGCCLEVDKPMLVYEYLSKGSLDDILHGSSSGPLTLEQRLNIAAESAEGLAYMHSKTGKIILHGDVKPANILLNDSFTPKISDFGISRLIVLDKEHTDLVIGDRTYMDPVYLRDGLLTDKSDVYSFGVVLLELISRKKATYSDNNSLVRSFLDAHKNQKEATELFDKEIAKTEVLKIIIGIYEIAVSCLNLDVDERPNMTQVEASLLMLKGDLVMISQQAICMPVD